jgi:hypothetical protein
MTHLVSPYLRPHFSPAELYSLYGNICSFLNADITSHAGQCCFGRMSICTNLPMFALVHPVDDTLATRFGGAQ